MPAVIAPFFVSALETEAAATPAPAPADCVSSELHPPSQNGAKTTSQWTRNPVNKFVIRPPHCD